jgi:hypothetical protein
MVSSPARATITFTLDRYGHLYEDRSDELSERLDSLLATEGR